MSWNFELIVEPYGEVAEGPAWDGSGLLFTQIQACRIMRWDPQTRECTVFRDNTDYANGLMLSAKSKRKAFVHFSAPW